MIFSEPSLCTIYNYVNIAVTIYIASSSSMIVMVKSSVTRMSCDMAPLICGVACVRATQLSEDARNRAPRRKL